MTTITTAPFDGSNPSHVDGLAALFEASHCPCYCRYWHFTGDKNDWQQRCFVDVGENERELREAAAASTDEASGVVALAAGVVVGWSKVAPAAVVTKFYEQRYYRGLNVLRSRPTDGVFTVGCMLVHPSFRQQGVAHALALAAVDLARARGAASLEAFPRWTESRVSDEQHWMGPEDAFREAGFTAVDPTPPYPVYRLALR